MEIAERVQRGRQAIIRARRQGLDTSRWEYHLADLLDKAGREPNGDDGLEPWILWQWGRISIPEWRIILQESL